LTPDKFDSTCARRTGLRIEETARLADQVNGIIRDTIPKDELTTVLDNIGLPYSGINLTYSNAGTIGSSDAEILVQLKEVRGKPTSMYINDLREKLPQRFPGVQFFFQPADIVTQILNFGTPAPIDVEVTGMNQRGNYLVGEKLASEFRHIPGAVDVHVQQAFDNPTLYMEIDRARAQSVGMQSRDSRPKRSCFAQLQLPDRAGLLVGPEKWRGVFRRGAGAAVSRGLLPGAAKYSH